MGGRPRRPLQWCDQGRRGYVVTMSRTPPEPVDPEVAETESLANTDVRGRIDKDPEQERNREQAPDPDDLPKPDPATEPPDL